MSILRDSFIEAFKVWHEKAPEEKLNNRSPTKQFFDKLGKSIETQAIKLGFGGLKVKASAGQGCWAEIPWIGLRNPYLTDSFEEGEYVVYLFSIDYNAVFLGLIQGVTRLSADELAERTPRIRKEIQKPEGFSEMISGHLSLTITPNSKPDKYERGLLYSKKYSVQSLPDEDILIKDLKATLNSYREYVNKNI